MNPRKRGRKGDNSGSRTNHTTEMESSNSTMQQFLGPRLKSWMVDETLRPTRQFSTESATHPASSNHNTAAQTTSSTTGSHIGIAQFTPPNIDTGRCTLTPSSRQKPYILAPAPNSAPPLPANSTTEQDKTQQSGIEVIEILPSPSPSDDVHHNLNTINIEQERDEDTLIRSNSGQAAAISRLARLAETYGGVEEMARLLARTGNTVEGLANVQTTNSPSNLGIARPVPRDLDSENPLPAPSAHASENSIQPLTRPASVAMAKQSIHNPNNNLTRNYSQDIMGPEHLSRYIKVLSTRLELVLKAGVQARGDLEAIRLYLLRQALESGDVFYLAMHQIYCLSYLTSTSHLPAACLNLSTLEVQGIEKFGGLVLQNDRLLIDAIWWFSTFPLPLDDLLKRSRKFSIAYGEARKCLKNMAEGWDSFKGDCIERKVPPLVDYLKNELNVMSTIMQHIIYTSIQRMLWIGPVDICYYNTETLFRKNQYQSQDWQIRLLANDPPSKEEVLEYYQKAINEYQRLRIHHFQHLQHDSLPSQRQPAHSLPSINTVMNPPHVVPVQQNRASNSLTLGRQLLQQSTMLPNALSNSPVQNAQHALNPRINAQRRQSYHSGPPLLSSPSPSPSSSSSPALSLNFSPMIPFQHNTISRGSTNSVQPVPTRSLSNPRAQPISPSYAQFNAVPHAVPSTTLRESTVSQLPVGSSHTPPRAAIPGPMQNTLAPTQIHQNPGPLPPQWGNFTHFETRQTPGNQRTNMAQALPSGRVSAGHHTMLRTIVSSTDTSTQRQYTNPSVLPRDTPSTQLVGYSTSMNPGSESIAIIPPAGRTMAVLQHPNLELSALHQAHLRDANLVITKSVDTPKNAHYQSLEGFAMEPFVIKPQMRNFTGRFEISKAEMEVVPKDDTERVFSIGGPPTRLVTSGSTTYRLRCIKCDGSEDFNESQWAVKDTTWPSALTIKLNGQHLEIRRKAHHGKDLPIDVTTYIKQGTNTINAYIIRVKKAPDAQISYTLAVEKIAIKDTAQAKSEVGSIDAETTPQLIRTQLSNKDPDAYVVGGDIIISLLDPFSSAQMRTPVRGKGCRHYECFDLDLFLQTRQGSPCKPEQFRCPICAGDARPKVLVTDEWVADVLKQVKAAGRADARAIVLDGNAVWRIREEGEGVDGTGESGGSGHARSTPSLKIQQGEVIKLD